MTSNYGSIASASAAAAATTTTTTNGSNAKNIDDTENEPLLDQTRSRQPTKASIWSILVFGWFGPVLEIGNDKKKLDPEDLQCINLPTDCTTEHIMDKFNYYWEREKQKTKDGTTASSDSLLASPSILRALYYSFGTDFIRAGFLKLVHDASLFVGPQVLNGLIHFLRDSHAPMTRGLALTAAVTVSQLLMSFCLRHYFFKCYLTGLRIRSAVVVAVYNKALVLHSAERQTRTLGEITNLMSIDAQRMQDLTTYLHAVWYSFVQIGLALFFLFHQLGASCLGGVVVIIIMMPVTKAVSKYMGNMQRALMTAKDKRVEVNCEVLANMKVIKLQAWEESFENRILALRELELKQLWRYVLCNSLSIMLWSATPLAVALATFSAYIWSGHKLEVASALTALALFDILRFPLFMLPQVINNIVEAGVSMERIRSFLLCDEHTPVLKGDLNVKGIRVENASFAYESKKPKTKGLELDPVAKELADHQWEITLLKSQLQETESRIKELVNKSGPVEEVEITDGDFQSANLLCLKRINFECKEGELIAIIGGVGSGKSSFINAILGEVRSLCGRTSVNGSLSYFAQSPFIMNDTVKSNILFGHVDEHVDEEKYQRALDSCSLRYDLELLPAGDQTEIGEKGITLSGGQKARVSLARAIYHSADICLLDDPLAAVDAHVGTHLFQKCIIDQLLLCKGESQNGGTRKKKTVVLVTNALQYLSNPRVDRIVVVRDGRVVEQGSYTELSKSDSLFAKFLAVMAETGVSPITKEGVNIDNISNQLVPGKESNDVEFSVDTKPVVGEAAIAMTDEQTGAPKPSGALMTDEIKERESGHVDLKIYAAWGKAAGGIWAPFAIIFAYAIVEFINVLSKWWLTYWSEHAGTESQVKFLMVYALINLASISSTLLRLILLMACGLRASRKLFVRLLRVILHAPMSFFDTTPAGRITNRFSKDMYTVDEKIASTLRSYLSTMFTVFSTIIVISGITPIFTACLVPILVYYLLQQAYFTITYRELKRLDSVWRSPIYALLGETLDGVSTIRAYAAEPTLSRRLNAMLDRQQLAYFLTSTAQCWLAVRLELVGTLIVTFACLCCVLQHGTKGGDGRFAALAGLSISYALSVTQSLNWTVRMGSDLEAAMVAVERIEQYCEIKSEASRHTPSDSLISPDWPIGGEIKFRGSKLRYRPGLPLILKGLDIHIPAGSKVGVVGRTGAGKSTLMIALLRIVELDEGKIFIDGVDHKKLGLKKLRSKIAVIPQDPILFSGSVRTNLDPFGLELDDARLYQVLTRVGLYTSSQPTWSSSSSLSSMANAFVQSLDDEVQDGGGNFSVGQRQLMVIARALLGGATIVIMDEATASVDADTDARIQAVMRSEFAKATTITVAHRINTIMDSDFILVMDNGRASEFDTPQALLARGGMFADLVEAAGKEGN